MSQHTYNGITFVSPLHTSFRQEAVYDDLGHTDRVGIKLDITVQSVINVAHIATIGVPPAADGAVSNAAYVAKYMREKLLIPRKTWSIKFGGVEMVPEHGTAVDSTNGPFPQDFSFTLLTNETFIATFRCTGQFFNEDGRGYLTSFRWTESVSIDNCNYSTRNRRGKFSIRSDNTKALTADKFRAGLKSIIGVPEGFNRRHSRFTLSANGLEVDFDIEDEEVFRQPPFPAFEAEGTYTESTTKLGNMRFGEYRIRLKGDKKTDPALLTRRCVEIAAAKLLLNGGAAEGNPRQFAKLETCVISYDDFKNVASCTMKCMLNFRSRDRSPTSRVNGVPCIDFKALTSKPLHSDVAIPNYKVMGTAALLLQAAKYWDPDADITIDPGTGQLNNGTEPGTGRAG